MMFNASHNLLDTHQWNRGHATGSDLRCDFNAKSPIDKVLNEFGSQERLTSVCIDLALSNFAALPGDQTKPSVLFWQEHGVAHFLRSKIETDIIGFVGFLLSGASILVNLQRYNQCIVPNSPCSKRIGLCATHVPRYHRKTWPKKAAGPNSIIMFGRRK
jgi:hypothetical protein